MILPNCKSFAVDFQFLSLENSMINTATETSSGRNSKEVF